jgi:hypothetical protein
MRFHSALISSRALAAASSAAAQVVVATPKATTIRGTAPAYALRIDSPKTAIGVSTSVSTGVRDTLGLLVSSVVRNSPAEKAGIEEGNRIAMINGVSLRLATADLGDPDMERLMGRRLTRELDKVKPGDEVDLRVYGNGQTRSVKVKTVSPDSLYGWTRTDVRRKGEDRATLGLSLGSSGSKRDTLGIFVMSVNEDGPSAKAGIEEGFRIAAINGVDLRVSRDDAGDDLVATTKLNRLERELGKVKPGDAVELRVFANGQTRTIKVTTAAASDLRGSTTVRIIRDGAAASAIIRPPVEQFEIDGETVGVAMKRAIEKAQAVTGQKLEDFGQFLDGVGRGMGSGGTIRWMHEDETLGNRITQPTPAPKAPLRRTVIWM